MNLGSVWAAPAHERLQGDESENQVKHSEWTVGASRTDGSVHVQRDCKLPQDRQRLQQRNKLTRTYHERDLVQVPLARTIGATANKASKTKRSTVYF